MTWDHVTVPITEGDVVGEFSALEGNDENPMDWICAIIKANNDANEVGTICTNISESESTYIHNSYNLAYWSAYALLVNLTVLNPANLPPQEFASICSIMGIKSIRPFPPHRLHPQLQPQPYVSKKMTEMKRLTLQN